MKQYAFNTIWPWLLVAFQLGLLVLNVIDPQRNELVTIVCIAGFVLALAWAVTFTAQRAALRILFTVLNDDDDDYAYYLEHDDEPELPHA